MKPRHSLSIQRNNVIHMMPRRAQCIDTVQLLCMSFRQKASESFPANDVRIKSIGSSQLGVTSFPGSSRCSLYRFGFLGRTLIRLGDACSSAFYAVPILITTESVSASAWFHYCFIPTIAPRMRSPKNKQGDGYADQSIVLAAPCRSDSISI